MKNQKKNLGHDGGWSRAGLRALACLLFATSAFSADNIHWTITGPTSVTVDWRGSGGNVFYGLTSSYGQSVAAVSQAGTLCDPAAVPGNSLTGPYKEAKITGLQLNTVYHYKIGSNGADHTFHTPPPPGASGFTVMVEGDLGDAAYYSNVASVQAMIAADLPDLVLVVGDLTYKNAHGADNDIVAFNDVMVWSQDAPYMPAWGNHEWDDAAFDDLRNYKGRFNFPNPQRSTITPIISDCGEDWYWFDYGNTRFIAVPEPMARTGGSSDEAAWTQWYDRMVSSAGPMAAAQNDPNIRFIVTFGHRPAYSSGHHEGEPTLRGYMDALGCQYAKYVLDFCAHSHNYERTTPQKGSSCSHPTYPGVVHVTAGTGGADLERDGSCLWQYCTQPSWSAARYMRQGVVKLSITASGISGAFLCGPAGGGANDISCAQGSVIDSFIIGSDPCIGAPNGTACNDDNACTQIDFCVAGACTGSNAVVCVASDACHEAGSCSPATGLCSNPSKGDGAACSDANACTQIDFCVSGVCTGVDPVLCSASDACHTAGTCSPATGLCSNPSKGDGAACSDANACTQIDFCVSGVCTGSNAVVCVASDACHEVGTCSPATGLCSNPSKGDGAGCSDANACTHIDFCVSGVCTGVDPVLCSASDACHSSGTCNPATGVCSNPTKDNGTLCNDANACTDQDKCQSGVCVGVNAVLCTASDLCHATGTCNPETGTCSNPAGVDGIACDDGNNCTTNDACANGSCVGEGSPVPDEVDYGVRLSESAGTTTISWNLVLNGTWFEVLRGLLSALPVGGSGEHERCLEYGLAETLATDPSDPGPDEGFWYLIRGTNVCGGGAYGFRVEGGVASPRQSKTCP